MKWEKVRLTDLCEQIADCPHSTPLWTDQGVVVLRNQNIRNGRLDLSSPSFTDEAHFENRIRRAKLRSGDLVITREAPMGEVCIIPEGLRCCLGQRMVMLRPSSDKCDSRYLLYALQSPGVQHEIRVNEGTGSTVSNLRIPILEGLPIPCPPIHEQRTVGLILGNLDDKIELNRRMNETLEAMAQALFKSWFVDSAQNGLPKTWRQVSLGDLIEVKHGYAFEGEFFSGEPTQDILLTPGNFAIGGGFKGDKLKYYDGPVPDEFILSEEDLVVTMTDLSKAGDTLGYGALLPAPPDGHRFLHNQRVGKVLITDSSIVGRAFLFQVLRSESYRNEILGSATGSTVKHTSPSRIKSFRSNLPPPDLMKAYEDLAGKWLKLVAHNVKESRTLSTLRDSLLPKLLNGELQINVGEYLGIKSERS